MKKAVFQIFRSVAILMFATSACLAQWTSSTAASTGTMTSIASIGSKLFAARSLPTGGGGVFVSTNAGSSWTSASSGMGVVRVQALAVIDTFLFAGADSGVYVSATGGASWTAAKTGLTSPYTTALFANGTTLFAGTYGGVFRSTDNGAHWTAVNTGLTNTGVHAFAAHGTNLFAGTDGGVFVSGNNGGTWTAVTTGLTGLAMRTMLVVGNNIFAGTFSTGVFRSTNDGATWSLVNTGLGSYDYVYALAATGTNLFLATSGGGVYFSADTGSHWGQINTGLPSYLYSVAVIGSYVYAGDDGGAVWRRPLTQIITAVEEPAGGIPARFALNQNYPNPFNPTTVIQFSVGTYGHTSLRIFDILGRSVATLVDGHVAAGTHEVHWNAANVPSGIYFCRLTSGSFSATRTLLLLK